jgi:hypothetical protein
MTDITTRLRSIYVSEGSNYVTEAADLIECLRAERRALVNDVHSCHSDCQKAGCVNRRLRERVTHLEDALRKVAASHAWNLFGECRAFGPDRIPSPRECDAIAHAALGETK